MDYTGFVPYLVPVEFEQDKEEMESVAGVEAGGFI
jgi:hypothetical protein